MQPTKNFWGKLVIRLSLFTAIFVAIIFSFYAWLFIPFIATVSPLGNEASTSDKYFQDIEVLKTYAELDRSFDGERRRRNFNQFVGTLADNVGDLSNAQFELAVAQAVALSQNTHSNVSPIERSKRFNTLPIRIGRFDDGYFVVQAETEHADLLGAELITIERTSIEEVEDLFSRYYGGVARRAELFSSTMITSPELLYAANISESPTSINLQFSLDGDLLLVERNFIAVPANGQAALYGQDILSYEIKNNDEFLWRHLMEESRTSPLYLARPDLPYLYEHLEEADGAYIKLNSLDDGVELHLKEWLSNVANDLQKLRPVFAIVDLRFNEGGDDFPEEFAKRLPSLVKESGPIYVITGSQTFAEGIGAAALIKRYAGERMRVAGSLVGDSLRYAGSIGSRLILPNSGIEIPVWTGVIDYARGCWDWEICDWFSPFFRDDGIMHLNPDIFADLDFASYLEGRDPILDAIMEDVGRGLY